MTSFCLKSGPEEPGGWAGEGKEEEDQGSTRLVLGLVSASIRLLLHPNYESGDRLRIPNSC